MTDAAQGAGGAAAGTGSGESDRFGGSLGSQHKDTPDQGPDLQQGPSGGSPRQQRPPATIGGQLGGLDEQASPAQETPAGPKKRKSGCFGMLLIAACASAVVISVLAAL